MRNSAEFQPLSSRSSATDPCNPPHPGHHGLPPLGIVDIRKAHAAPRLLGIVGNLVLSDRDVRPSEQDLITPVPKCGWLDACGLTSTRRLVDWVEKGTPPQSITATVAAGNVDKPASSSSAIRSRPLCPYPTKAVLKSGATDLESAASFTCQ